MIFAEDILSAVWKDECEKLSRVSVGRHVLELGSDFGRSTVAIASAAVRVHAVDWHLGDEHTGGRDSAAEFVKNITRYGVREKIVMHMGRFEDVLPLFREKSFGMIFLDALHTREAVESDIARSMPLLAKNGIMAFHDYGTNFPGVTEAVDRLVSSRCLRKEVVRTLAVVYWG